MRNPAGTFRRTRPTRHPHNHDDTPESQRTDPATVHLPRLNATGFCRQCLTRGCVDHRCLARWRGFVWTECDTCHGSGSADYTLALANGGPDHVFTNCHHCTDGVLEQDP